MEELELKHVAPYLPYGLKCIVSETNSSLDDFKSHVTALRITDNEAQCGYDFYPMLCIKPILRPITDLVKEIDGIGLPILQLAKLEGCVDTSDTDYKYVWQGIGCGIRFNIINDDNDDMYDVFGFDTANGFGRHFRPSKKWIIVSSQLELFQKLFEWHFDVFGLIDKGLAIDINTTT